MAMYKAVWHYAYTMGTFDEPYELDLECENAAAAYNRAYGYALYSGAGLPADDFELINAETGEHVSDEELFNGTDEAPEPAPKKKAPSPSKGTEPTSIILLAELIQLVICEDVSAHDKAVAIKQAIEDNLLTYDEGLDLIIAYTH